LRSLVDVPEDNTPSEEAEELNAGELIN
jgi:hypothetical protein